MRLSVQTIKKQAKNGRFVSKALFEHVHSLIFDKNISESPDRKYFELSIIPFLAQIGVKNVLFVGCRAYTQHYPRLFEEQGITLFTCDIDPFSERYGSPGRHRTIDVCAISPQVFPVAFDAAVFSGVIGFGVDTVPQIERAALALASLLAPGSVLVQGWNSDRSCDPLANPVWQSRFTRTCKTGMTQRISFKDATHVFDILERREAA